MKLKRNIKRYLCIGIILGSLTVGTVESVNLFIGSNELNDAEARLTDINYTNRIERLLIEIDNNKLPDTDKNKLSATEVYNKQKDIDTEYELERLTLELKIDQLYDSTSKSLMYLLGSLAIGGLAILIKPKKQQKK